MKKGLIKLALLAYILMEGILNAQTSDTAYQNRINYIFEHVKRSRVTTGLLFEYGLHFIPPQYFDGTLQDSNEVEIEIH